MTFQPKSPAEIQLAERLRSRAGKLQRNHGNYLYYDAGFAETDLAAADLIDSLTKEVEGLKEALEWIADAADPDAGENYRADDREGCLDFVHATARRALSTSGRAEP